MMFIPDINLPKMSFKHGLVVNLQCNKDETEVQVRDSLWLPSISLLYILDNH